MGKITITMGVSTSISAAKKVPKVASNTQTGLLQGLQKDLAEQYEKIEERLDDIGSHFDEFSDALKTTPMTADGSKLVSPALRDAIKQLKLANTMVDKAARQFAKVASTVAKAAHPDAELDPEDEEEIDPELAPEELPEDEETDPEETEDEDSEDEDEIDPDSEPEDEEDAEDEELEDDSDDEEEDPDSEDDPEDEDEEEIEDDEDE